MLISFSFCCFTFHYVFAYSCLLQLQMVHTLTQTVAGSSRFAVLVQFVFVNLNGEWLVP